MKRSIVFALLLASTLAATPPTGGSPGQPMPPTEPGPPPSTGTGPMSGGPSAAPSDAAMLARAKTAFAQLQGGTLQRDDLNAQMSAALTDDKLAAVKAAFGTLGAPVSFVQVRTGSESGYPYGVYLVTFANGTKVNFIFSVDAQGKIAGMQLTAAQ